MNQWYVVNSKPQKESLLCDQLELRGIETYYPRLRVKPVNPRAHKVKPYFPGYLFASLDLQGNMISGLRWMPGVKGLVSFGGEPATVPEDFLQKIRLRVDEINSLGAELRDGLKPGAPIVIRDGLFKGYAAIFDAHVSGNKRVRVLLELLKGRQFRVELSVEQVERIKQS